MFCPILSVRGRLLRPAPFRSAANRHGTQPFAGARPRCARSHAWLVVRAVRSAYASQEAHTKVVSRRDTRVNVPYDWLVSASISRSTERTVVQSMCRCNSGSLATPQHTRSALQDTGILQEASLALGNAKRHFVLRETSCACRAGIGARTHVSI